jgi:hypothetical protein
VAISDRLKHAWNAFQNQGVRERTAPYTEYYGASYGVRPDKVRLVVGNGKTIISSIYTRLAIDISTVDVRHVRVDKQRRYLEDIDSGLNQCLTVEANTDQAATQFRRDIAFTLFDRGVAAIVPVDTSLNPNLSGGFDIKTMRVGTVVTWYPRHVRVNLYNEETGVREDITLPKSAVAIVENPLYSVMNEPNSTLQRLLTKLAQLDAIDEQSSSGKLDIIIQLPYTIKSDARRQQAEQRRKDIEFQLSGNKYGVAYTDGTEKVTQLNRPAENNLMKQIEFLTDMLYGQLGLTPEVMNGTADEKQMNNYWARTIEPILDELVEAMRRSFLTKTARSQLQWILYFKDPFKLVPMSEIAEIADKFTRNEILASNEIRQYMGIPPSQDPKADQLINSNMPVSDTGVTAPTDAPTSDAPPADDPMAGAFDEIDSLIDSAFADLGVDDATA